MSPLVTTLLSISSAVVVAVIGHLLTVRRQRRDELAEMRIRAYADFLGATARLVTARRNGHTEDELEDLAMLNDAKNRILICAEKPVVEQLINFWKNGGTLESEPELLAFKRFCLAIRLSLGLEWKEMIELPLSDTIFKLKPSDYSFIKQNKG